MEIVKVSSDEEFLLVSKLAEEIWKEHFISIIIQEQIDYMLGKYQSYSTIKNQIENENYNYYLIKDLEEGEQGYFAIAPKDGQLFLSKIYIRKSSRGRGYARKAIEFIKEFAKDHSFNGIFLTVNRHNTDTINIYKKMGFKIIKETDSDIGNGFFMNDYIMKLEI